MNRYQNQTAKIIYRLVRVPARELLMRAEPGPALPQNRGGPGRCRVRPVALAAGDCADDQVWLLARYDRIGQRGIRRLVREILLAGEEADKGPPLLRDLIADRAAKHRVLGLDGVENRTLRDRTVDRERQLPIDARHDLEIGRQNDADHFSVWTSTETTDGRSRTIAFQVSPESFEA